MSQTHDWGRLSALGLREIQVLSQIAKGLSTEQIAKSLYRSEKTVEYYRINLGRKTGAANRATLARLAIDAGLHLLNPEEIEAMLGGAGDAHDVRDN